MIYDFSIVSARLVGGSDVNEGRVEILHHGAWGTVCDDGWDIQDAEVVCRMLGYDVAVEAPGSARFGAGSGQIVLDNVLCSGYEENLADCTHPCYGLHDCGHSEDAGVNCGRNGWYSFNSMIMQYE